MTDPVPADHATHADDDHVETSVNDLVEDELLVEDVSIDGMCGVY